MKVEKIENINDLKDVMKKEKKSREENIEARDPKNFGELIDILKKEHEETFKDITLEARLINLLTNKRSMKTPKIASKRLVSWLI